VQPPLTWKPHAADRWARAVMALVPSPDDPKNLESWGKFIGVSRGALRVWCQATNLRPKQSLDFARLLRAVVLAQGRTWDPANFLDIVDPRSMQRLLERGALPRSAIRTPPSVHEFIVTQRIVQHEEARSRLIALLSRHLSMSELVT
jgi:hypothetical protein